MESDPAGRDFARRGRQLVAMAVEDMAERLEVKGMSKLDQIRESRDSLLESRRLGRRLDMAVTMRTAATKWRKGHVWCEGDGCKLDFEAKDTTAYPVGADVRAYVEVEAQ